MKWRDRASVTSVLAVGTVELCLQMVAEGTTSGVQLLQSVVLLLSPSLSVCVELRDLSDLL